MKKRERNWLKIGVKCLNIRSFLGDMCVGGGGGGRSAQYIPLNYFFNIHGSHAQTVDCYAVSDGTRDPIHSQS